MTPVDAPLALVPPRSPFQIPDPKHAVAPVDVKDAADVPPTAIVLGEKEREVTIGPPEATGLHVPDTPVQEPPAPQVPVIELLVVYPELVLYTVPL